MGITPNGYYKEIINKIPANRLTNPDEIAKIALFIASDDASYINGVSLVADGAFTY